MKNIYKETVSLCPICAGDSTAFYEESPKGMYLSLTCGTHGAFSERVERDADFFKDGYEREYKKRSNHMLVPVTYRCNLNCKHCYSLSNAPSALPKDRPIEKIAGFVRCFNGSITLIGGEPTIREDLFDVIRAVKDAMGDFRLSICTNGYKLTDRTYIKKLRASGVDFVYLTVNDIEYESSKDVYINKLKALKNCMDTGLPVSLARTMDNLRQIDTLDELLEKFGKTVFRVTVRAARPYGIYHPINPVYVSDMLKHLKKEKDHEIGTMPFYRYVRMKGKRVSLRSWVLDMKMTDPLDHNYIISNDTLTTLRRGIKMDEAMLLGRYVTQLDDSQKAAGRRT